MSYSVGVNTEAVINSKQEQVASLSQAMRSNGVYYTALHNPFLYKGFIEWAKKHNISKRTILEPYAGSNNIIDMLQASKFCKNFTSYDINPAAAEVQQRDTIKNYPKGYEVCITNPPWLYKSSASRRALPFPKTFYDDLYKHCLALCLDNSPIVGALIPASFIQSGLFRNRLEKIIFIHKRLFKFTENPVCLALFGSESVADVEIYLDNRFVGKLKELEKHLPSSDCNRSNHSIKFNDQQGELGFIGIDNNVCPSIRFCYGDELKNYQIKESSRAITRISIQDFNISDKFIHLVNNKIQILRDKTHDIFLTTFKGMRKDGFYRRRMEYALARGIITDSV